MSTTVEVPESQRLIAVSLGKIAASRGQKGGINLHKNLLVATVLHKARTAYMIQQFAKQRASQSPPPPTTTTTTSSSPPPSNVEMREQSSDVSEPSSTTSSPSSTAAPTSACGAPSTPAAPPSAGVAVESGSAHDGADVSSVQVAECEDKENTPPPSSPAPQGDATPCEKRLQGENVNSMKDSANERSDKSKPHGSVTQTQKSTRDYVSKGCSSCLLKRRRAMASDHENVSAPKVRIVDTRLSQQQQDSNPEPMQCDSPQISNLVNIFSSSFAGLSGAGGDASVRSVVVSVSTHKLTDASNMATCAKELKAGLDSVRQPLVLSV